VTLPGPFGSTAGWAMVMNMGRLSYSYGTAVFAAGPPVIVRFRDGRILNPQTCGQLCLMQEKYAHIQAFTVSIRPLWLMKGKATQTGESRAIRRMCASMIASLKN
jgi:hypothetical protein